MALDFGSQFLCILIPIVTPTLPNNQTHTRGIYISDSLDFGGIKLPPQNIEAEEAVLAGILLDPEVIGRVVVVLLQIPSNQLNDQ